MKKAFTIWIEDDAEILAICGGIAVIKSDKSDKSVSFINFNEEKIKECNEYIFRVVGEMLEV